MSPHEAGHIEELALGALSADERGRAEAHVASCPACRRALAELDDLLARTSLALPPVEPSSDLRARLMRELEGPRRYAPFASRVARLFALDERRADELLARAADVASYRALPIAGVSLANAAVGRSLEGASASFVRMEPGARFPMHRHDAEERVLVLEGGYREDDGREVHAGELVVNRMHSSHEVTVFEDSPCVSAVLLTRAARSSD
jgi:putative transcriptional regulator